MTYTTTISWNRWALGGVVSGFLFSFITRSHVSGLCIDNYYRYLDGDGPIGIVERGRQIEAVESHNQKILRVVHRPRSFCSQISCGGALELDLGKKGRTYGFEMDAARGTRWNAEPNSGGRCFIAAEDLTTQAGIAMQQDLTLSTTLICADVERKSDHYGGGMGAASAEERAVFAVDHPDIYELSGNRLNLKVTNGEISLAALQRSGFGI